MGYPPAWEGFGACGPGHSILRHRPQPGLVESWLRANVRRCACWGPFSSESRPVSHVTQNLPSTLSHGTISTLGTSLSTQHTASPQADSVLPSSAQPWGRSAKPAARCPSAASVQRSSRGQQAVQPEVRAGGSSPLQVMRPYRWHEGSAHPSS